MSISCRDWISLSLPCVCGSRLHSWLARIRNGYTYECVRVIKKKRVAGLALNQSKGPSATGGSATQCFYFLEKIHMPGRHPPLRIDWRVCKSNLLRMDGWRTRTDELDGLDAPYPSSITDASSPRNPSVSRRRAKGKKQKRKRHWAMPRQRSAGSWSDCRSCCHFVENDGALANCSFNFLGTITFGRFDG